MPPSDYLLLQQDEIGNPTAKLRRTPQKVYEHNHARVVSNCTNFRHVHTCPLQRIVRRVDATYKWSGGCALDRGLLQGTFL